jgi:Secretion system C-terminal sorting domain
MKKKLVLSVIYFLFVGSFLGMSQSLVVWPGDVNSNGVVNNIDFLGLGLAYNSIGPARNLQSTNFQPIIASPWAGSFADGTNYANADCNGDGLVNFLYDAFPIFDHYDSKHGLLEPDIFMVGTSIDYALTLGDLPTMNNVISGQNVELPILLGNINHPIEDFYGIAFSIHIDPTYIDPSTVEVDMTETSWANPDNDRISASFSPQTTRKDVALVRIDHNDKNGYGRIGKLNFIVIDDVVGLHGQLRVILDSIRMIDKFGDMIAVEGDTLILNVNFDSSPISNLPREEVQNLEIFPNPANQYFSLKTNISIEHITLSNMIGEVLLEKYNYNQEEKISVATVPFGVYLLKIETKSGVLYQKIIISH